MKSLSAKTFQCGVTVQGLTTLSGTVYLTALTNTATWDYVVVGTTAQGQLYTRTYAQLMSDITSGIGLSGYVPTSRTLTINGVSYDLTANRSWTISTVDYTSRLQHQVKAGVAINKGQAVYVTSADGTNMIVGLASNASEATSSKTMGLLDATVSINGFANVVTEGLLAGLDTSAAGTEGDPVWLGTGGNLIYGLANKPYAPAHLVFIGIVTRKNSNNGEIFVKVQNGFELNEIHDVDLITTTPVNGHLLGFNGTLWVNKTIAGWLGYTPANASGTTNYLSKFTGSTTLGNSQIFDNGTNVGIGTASPSYLLHVNGTSYFNGNMGVNGEGSGVTVDTGYGNNGRVGFMKYGGYEGMLIAGNATLLRLGHRTDNAVVAGGTPTIREDLVITAAGNVGIGTTNPLTKLWIEGNDITLNTEGSSQAKTLYFRYSNGGAVNADSYLTFGTGGSPIERMRITSDGQFWFKGVSTSTGYEGAMSNTETTFDIYGSRYGGTGKALTFWATGAAESMRITSTGNIGIGTTSPSKKLEVANSDIKVNGLTIGKGPGNISAGYNHNIAFGVNNFNSYSIADRAHIAIGYNAFQNLTAGYYSIAIGGYALDAALEPDECTAIGLDALGSATYPSRSVAVGNGALLSDTEGYGNVAVGARAGNYVNSAFGGYGENTFIGNSAANALKNARETTVLGAGALWSTTSNTNLSRANTAIGASSAWAWLSGRDNVWLGYNTNGFINGSYNVIIGANVSSTAIDGAGTLNNSIVIGDGQGNVRIFSNSVGNVGIGTTSPSAKLDVNGAQIIQSAAGFGTDADQAALFLSNTANFGLSGSFSGYSRNLIKSDGGSLLTVGRWNTSLIGELSIESGSSGLIKFLAGASERMRITSGGNVGIGTTAPAIPRGSGFRPMLHVYNNSAGTNPAIVVSAEDNQMAGYIAGDNAGSSDIGWGWNAYYQGSGNNFYNIRIGDNGTWTDRFTIDRYGLVGIGTTTPSTLLDVSGVITATGGNSTNWNTAYGWGNHSSAGYVPQARTLTINGTSYDLSANRSWTIATTTPGGSDTQFQYNSSGSLAGASALTYNSTTNRVGINQASPGYDLDVNGQVRVQDKLRIGTGNGVVHMSSSATINANTTTVVWAQTVSVGMCAFIEYYILNNNSLTDQRAGTIMVTWNQSGTPTITHTETTTPDIGSTTTVNFTSSLVGSDARINAVNSSANPYTMVMSYKYF